MTALDRGFDRLANILMQNRQMQAQAQQQERGNRLADLQYKQLQREDDYQTGLQGAMSNPKGPVSTTSVIPESPRLGLSMLAGQAQPQQFQLAQVQSSPIVAAYRDGRVQTTTTPGQTRAQAGAEYALSQGRIDDAVKMFSVDDAVAQLQAKGDLQGYYKAKQELDQGKQFFETVKPYTKNPAAMKQLWPQIQRMFPNQTAGINPEDIQDREGATFMPLEVNGQIIPNRAVYHDADGSIKIVDTTPKEQPETWGTPELMTVGGKKAMVQKSSRGQVRPVLQDNSTTVKVTTGEKKERDLPTGIQDKLSQKLEIYNDWSTLKTGFKPEYMPKTAFKNIGEFQINLNKIFGNNQAAVDWWTQYFDARNIILKERSGAAVMEPEFKRFEQGTIAANTNPQSVINYLDRSEKKYKQHVDSYLEANRKNHPEAVSAFETAYGYTPTKAKASPPPASPSGPKPGSVVDGYRFKGGNPADKANWMKVKR